MWRPAVAAALCCALTSLAGCGRTGRGATPQPPHGAPAGDSTARLSNETGAVSSLPPGALTGRHVEDVAELLQGRVAGLQVIRLPNGDITLRIRGGDPSLNSESAGGQDGEVLLVIDGMPVQEGQLSNTLRALNPEEIASIQVLKDVSSTSIYGIRGAHGVILITMKRK